MNTTPPLLLLGIGTAGVRIARGVSRAFGDELRYATADTDASSAQSGDDFTLLGGDCLLGCGAGGDGQRTVGVWGALVGWGGENDLGGNGGGRLYEGQRERTNHNKSRDKAELFHGLTPFLGYLTRIVTVLQLFDLSILPRKTQKFLVQNALLKRSNKGKLLIN